MPGVGQLHPTRRYAAAAWNTRQNSGRASKVTRITALWNRARTPCPPPPRTVLYAHFHSYIFYDGLHYAERRRKEGSLGSWALFSPRLGNDSELRCACRPHKKRALCVLRLIRTCLFTRPDKLVIYAAKIRSYFVSCCHLRRGRSPTESSPSRHRHSVQRLSQTSTLSALTTLR